MSTIEQRLAALEATALNATAQPALVQFIADDGIPTPDQIAAADAAMARGATVILIEYEDGRLPLMEQSSRQGLHGL